MPPRVPLAVALAALLVSAGCLGASGGGGPATEATTQRNAGGDATAGTEPGSPTDGPTATRDATTASGVECPDDRERYRKIAVEHVAAETGADSANVTVVKDAFVDYPVLGACFYNAKVRNGQTRETHGVYVAENGTVVDREAVETRAERAYERKYGNLSTGLYERVQSADAGERISVVVSIADINRTAAKQAVDRENLNKTEYKEALSEEYERRAERKTEAVVAELREMEGVTVEYVGSLRIRISATPEAIQRVQRLDRVTWLDLRRETTTYLEGTAAGDEG